MSLTDDRYFEIVDGRMVDKKTGAIELFVANHLVFRINRFSVERRLGLAMVGLMYDFGKPGEPMRRPDVSLVLDARWPIGRRLPPGEAWAIVPDLVAEIIPPAELSEAVEAKILEYLQAGVRMVWIVHRETRRIYVHESPTSVRVIPPDGVLDGGDVLPEFRLPMAELFGV
jgi:Uma2 family endonuclease